LLASYILVPLIAAANATTMKPFLFEQSTCDEHQNNNHQKWKAQYRA
jgi:hypothetical protein